MRFGSKAFSLVTFTAIDTFGARAFPEMSLFTKVLDITYVANP